MGVASRPDEWRPGHPRWRATVARPHGTGYGAPGTGASPKRVRRAAIGLICAGTGPVQRGMWWEEDLPPGYRMREDADLLILLGPGGAEVAAFSALGADPLEVIAAAWEDFG